MANHDPAHRVRLPAVALAIASAAALAFLGWWICRPRDQLVTYVLADDAFYYFQTARSVAEGKGSLSSGGVAHNGYHPLWMLLCAAFFALTKDDLLAIRLILAFGALLNALAALLVYRILRLWRMKEGPSWFAAACFLANPFMLALSISGMEAPLNALLQALALLWIAGESPELPQRPARYLALGALLGLLYLVRTDNVFLIVATWACLAARARGHRRALLGLVLAAGVALLLASPWFAWNLIRFGSVVQGSATALPRVREIAFFDSHPGASATDFFRFRCARFLSWFPAIFYFTGLGSFLIVLLGAGIVALASRRGRRFLQSHSPCLWPFAPLLFAVVSLGFAHKFMRLATREWYYVSSNLMLILALGAAVDLLSGLSRRKPVRVAFWVVLVVAASALYGAKAARQWRPRPRIFALEILDRIERSGLLRPGETVGATDSGALGFFSSHPVVNLDGVVNNEASAAIRQEKLLDYAQRRGIRYVTITPRMFSARVWGPDFRRGLVPCPELTPEGYRVAPSRDHP